MAEPVLDEVVLDKMSLVDQVVPKLGDSWWNIMEKEFFRVFSEKEPTVFSTICGKAFGAVQRASAGSKNFGSENVDSAELARPYKFPPGFDFIKYAPVVERWPCGAERVS